MWFQSEIWVRDLVSIITRNRYHFKEGLVRTASKKSALKGAAQSVYRNGVTLEPANRGYSDSTHLICQAELQRSDQSPGV